MGFTFSTIPSTVAFDHQAIRTVLFVLSVSSVLGILAISIKKTVSAALYWLEAGNHTWPVGLLG